jgi:hypothetical protein
MVRVSASLPFYSAVAGFTIVGLACLLARDLRGPRQVAAQLIHPAAVTSRVAEPTVTLPIVAEAPAAAAAAAAAPPPGVPARAAERHYASLRSSIRWVRTRLGHAPDPHSRVLLAKSAAQRAALHEVGLGWRDVYGIIAAETSWVPRLGRSRDGTPNLGIAQFEPATARALGLRNPNDPVESVHIAAEHMKEAAEWSAARISGLRLADSERAAKLREGVSIYYNLSSRGRAAWNGRNTHRLPVETRRHIANARIGAQEAAMLDGQLQAMGYGRRPAQAVMAAAATGAGS